jgi:hypothetical protein
LVLAGGCGNAHALKPHVQKSIYCADSVAEKSLKYTKNFCDLSHYFFIIPHLQPNKRIHQRNAQLSNCLAEEMLKFCKKRNS